MRKLCLMSKIVNGCCPQHFKDYISNVYDKHRHNIHAGLAISISILRGLGRGAGG